MNAYNPADDGIDADREAMEADLGWPTEAEIADYHRDMAAKPEEHPTPEEVEAIVEEWLKYYDARVRITDDYYAALRVRGVCCPF